MRRGVDQIANRNPLGRPFPAFSRETLRLCLESIFWRGAEWPPIGNRPEIRGRARPLDEPLAHPPNASRCGENLDRHWLVPNSAGVDRPAAGCALARHIEHLQNRGPALRIFAYPPEGAAGAYFGPDGKLLARRLILDVAVREPKKQNRRRWHSGKLQGPPGEGLLRFLRSVTLNMHGVDVVWRYANDRPDQTLSAKRVADRGKGASRDGEVVFEVAVREPDYTGLRGHGTSPSALEIPVSFRRKRASSRPQLHKPLAHPPIVLDEQYRTELGEPIGGRIVECPKDRLAVDDRERENLRLGAVSLFELFGDVDEAARTGARARARPDRARGCRQAARRPA